MTLVLIANARSTPPEIYRHSDLSVVYSDLLLNAFNGQSEVTLMHELLALDPRLSKDVREALRIHGTTLYLYDNGNVWNGVEPLPDETPSFVLILVDHDGSYAGLDFGAQMPDTEQSLLETRARSGDYAAFDLQP